MFVRPKILIVEDEPDILNLLEKILQEENYDVLKAMTAEAGLEIIEGTLPTAIVADINLPGMSGLDFCKRVKSTHPEIPVLFLSGLSDEFDKVLGLELGAEDYITKPFNVREFKARIKVILRRVFNPPAKNAGGLGSSPDPNANVFIDVLKRQVFIEQIEVTLTKKEFDILMLLASRPGQVFTREHILDVIWHDDANVSDRTVDVHIGRLREKITVHPDKPPHVETVRGVGYRCNPHIQVQVVQ
ncbi:DNA-binding response regulator [bacterium (Candidatus Blackallbacteria) CG17_big_fil_post_rev_8_21_14_2_50_48_46]|uniref:DNA-binding response regulator n=1 Tax=bacterium (Candidatus Blackallbacteria) CG17_big_fil_post_rev_8_21_14_2_50_48_46 TaxID=2014261 RepID=A0A2M7G6A2_9BACT|nr:MAG: DNA-binding response regulator [bacterium (Candidatus Blackallbacteria) CG18_big_fil_WC_8_21_14_2_50_49_26]PIW17433.1 MAG: DNA-binding response regulator [bacterium (Candidatus Blackallbacteria) CG17_big_fil_post_rev_8_21_14_2_50_48_46]PIW48287.1 MAG: DNA-binding response regulator [bacterium (Candidatus Blackallbacteria) CG13_big_fil_rev_8_21_14_2_50_49_14]